MGSKVSEMLCCLCIATPPDPCHRTTLLNAVVPNFYRTLDFCSDLVHQFKSVRQIHAIYSIVDAATTSGVVVQALVFVHTRHISSINCYNF